MNAPVLSTPSQKYEASYLEAMREAHLEGRNLEDEPSVLGFKKVLARLESDRLGLSLAPGRVPQTTLWLTLGQTYLGRVAIRHSLNETLARIGGHIGYEIRPTERRKGYGTAALRMALTRTQALGLGRVLVTCDETNVGSRRIIERNGGLWEDAVAYEGGRKLRFWFELEAPSALGG